MFRFTSTGEPPTNNFTMLSSQEDESTLQTMGTSNNTINKGIQQKTNRGMPSLSTQEDSGYEASPSSTNDNCSFSFDGRRTNSEEVPAHDADCSALEDVNASDDAFGDSPSAILIMGGGQDDSDIDDEDLVVVGEFEDDSAFARRWALEPSSPGTSTIVGSDQCRPSSLPIPIPFGDDALSSRLRSAIDTDSHYIRRLHCHSLPLDVPPSQTTSPTSTTFFSPVTDRLGTTFPLSWPTMRPLLRTVGPVSLLSLRLAFAGSPTRQRTNRALTSRSSVPRSRRRIIDSDASSITSSDGDSMEEVFDDIEPALDELVPLVPGAPTSNGHLVFLPDVVPHSSATGSINMNGVRRSRSVSVNLPIEEAVVEVGRTLRRLSDQFNEQIRMRRSTRNRRYTISDIMRLTRRDDDNDDDTNSTKTYWRS